MQRNIIENASIEACRQALSSGLYSFVYVWLTSHGATCQRFSSDPVGYWIGDGETGHYMASKEFSQRFDEVAEITIEAKLETWT